MLRRRGHSGVAARLRLAVRAQGRGGLVLDVHVLCAVEDVLRRDVNHRRAVNRCLAGQDRRARRVRLPGRTAALGSLRTVHVRPCGRVDHHVNVIPRQGSHLLGVGNRHLGQVHARYREAGLGQRTHELAAQLAVRARHERAATHGGRSGEGSHVGHARVSLVLVGQDGALKRDRPIHGRRLVSQVQEGIARVR